MHPHPSRALFAASLILLVSCGGSDPTGAESAAGPQSQVLHVYNWADYIGEC